ncbi:MAG TPA: uroporphyrinogen decarboxylase family protein [Clostridia bacterium]|nr:uroporphyrinogen decarboxylase family protein [Clostridia bacterium]
MEKREIKPIRKPWAGTMTPRERFVRQMHFQSVDRSFNMEFGYWKELFSDWGLFRDNGIVDNREADVFFAFDPIRSISGKTFMNPPFDQTVVEDRGDSQIIINRDGLLAEVPKDGHETIPHFVKSSIVTPKDWKRVKEERFWVDDPDRLPDIETLKKQHPEDRNYPLGIYCASMIGKVRDMLTFEGICYAVYDYPDMVEDMIETCCQIVERILDHMLPHFTFDFASGWEDICFKNGPILSPDFFANVIAPRYKRINQKLKAHGIDVWYTDCDGDVRGILPILLDSGINCLFPFEVNCCSHPGELLDQYPGALRIMGGFDKMKLIQGKEAIKAYMKTLEPYVARGGYIPFCDHRCPADVKQEDYLYYLDLKERTFGLKA